MSQIDKFYNQAFAEICDFSRPWDSKLMLIQQALLTQTSLNRSANQHSGKLYEIEVEISDMQYVYSWASLHGSQIPVKVTNSRQMQQMGLFGKGWWCFQNVACGYPQKFNSDTNTKLHKVLDLF